MKGSTVDLVVTGDERAAVAAAVDAVRRGQRVLVVLRSGGPRIVPRLRRLCRAAKNQLTVMTNAEVVCVDGVDGVEAVVVRYTRTGRAVRREHARIPVVRRFEEPLRVGRCLNSARCSDRSTCALRSPQKCTLTQPRNLRPLRQFGGSFVHERTATFLRGARKCRRPLASPPIAGLTGTISGTIRTESGFP